MTLHELFGAEREYPVAAAETVVMRPRRATYLVDMESCSSVQTNAYSGDNFGLKTIGIIPVLGIKTK
jgi:hypothetical protein